MDGRPGLCLQKVLLLLGADRLLAGGGLVGLARRGIFFFDTKSDWIELNVLLPTFWDGLDGRRFWLGRCIGDISMLSVPDGVTVRITLCSTALDLHFICYITFTTWRCRHSRNMSKGRFYDPAIQCYLLGSGGFCNRCHCKASDFF